MRVPPIWRRAARALHACAAESRDGLANNGTADTIFPRHLVLARELVTRKKSAAPDRFAQLLVDKLLAERPVEAGPRVVPIVNGLGTVKYEELFVLFGHVERLLIAAGLEVIEPECGELVTSLDMSGASLTLFWVDEELERLWIAPAVRTSRGGKL